MMLCISSRKIPTKSIPRTFLISQGRGAKINYVQGGGETSGLQGLETSWWQPLEHFSYFHSIFILLLHCTPGVMCELTMIKVIVQGIQ